MASSSLREGLISKKETRNALENIDEIVHEHEDEFQQNVNENDDEAKVASTNDVHLEENVAVEAKNGDQKMPNQTAQFLDDKKKRKEGFHLALSHLNKIFLLFVLPLLIVLCIVVKISFQSIVYMLLLFLLPFFYPINQRTIANRIRNFLIILTTTCLLLLVGQLTFHVYLLANPPYANSNILPNCSLKTEILEESGFSRFDEAYLSDIMRLIIPDVLLLIVSIFCLILCNKVHKKDIEIKRGNFYNTKDTHQPTSDATMTDKILFDKFKNFLPSKSTCVTEVTQLEGETSRPRTSSDPKMEPSRDFDNSDKYPHKKLSELTRFWNSKVIPVIRQLIFMLLLFICATFWPSVLSIPYYVSFLALVLRLLFSRTIKDNLFQVVIKILLLFYLSLHILIIYVYQLKLFQYALPSNELLARLLGLMNAFYTDCNTPAHFFVNPDIKWQQCVYPFILFLLYWFTAVEFSYTDLNASLKKKSTSNNKQIQEITISQMYGQLELNNEKSNGAETDIEANLEIKEEEKQRLFVDEAEGEKVTSLCNSLGEEAEKSYNKTDSKTKRRQTAVFIDNTKMYLNMFAKFLQKQSYLLSLLSMMAWSIIYHSILGLVLLIWACFIWVMPRSREWCLRCSPLYVFYATCLLTLEFIYGLKLKSNELPEFVEIGLIKHEFPFLHLCIKAGLLLTFYFTLRQYINENKKAKLLKNALTSINQGSASTSSANTLVKKNIQTRIITWLHGFLIKYWIFLSSITLLLMSCQQPVVAYRIGYMILFLYFITTFQFTHSFWRATLYVFHLIVIVYSMVVLLLIYIFQFDEVPIYVKRVLNISDEVLSSIGFEKFDMTDQLIIRLLTPTTFLIVIILQIHYFNKPWLELTDRKLATRSNQENSARSVDPTDEQVNNEIVNQIQETQETEEIDFAEPRSETKRESFSHFSKRVLAKLNEIYQLLTIYAWRILELHVYKLTILILGIFCFNKVNLMNLILICSTLLSLMLDKTGNNEKRIRTLFSGFVQIWIIICVVATMIFQLKFIESPFIFNCNGTFANQSSVDPFLLKNHDSFEYLGIEKTPLILDDLKYYIFIMLLLSFQKIIKLKGKYERVQENIPEPSYLVIFENVSYKELDTGLVNFAKYMINFFFYRFGLELCFLMTAITIAFRMDAYAILYGVWLGLLLNLRRANVNRIWTAYFLFLLFLLALQYLWCLGLPPILCFEYPWSEQNQINPLNIYNKIRIWLFLPDYSDPPNSHYLIVDFLQVIFVWLQFGVFKLENNENPNIKIDTIAGSNIELVYLDEPYKDNPFRDFITEIQTNLDKIKYGIYMYSYWLALALVYLAGTSRISLLCLGYVIFSFYFFWYGQTFLVKPIEKLLKSWNIIVFYCFLVIFVKACLQIVFCLMTNVINDEKKICALVDIFGINCNQSPKNSNNIKPVCSKAGDSDDNISLFWDVVCFSVLLIQRRLFMSYMFEHAVNEYKAQSNLAFRGAKIFKSIVRHKVKEEKDKEKQVLEKLKQNVDRIRKHQSRESAHQPNEHYEAIRSGDYFMFDADYVTEETDSAIKEKPVKMRKKQPKPKPKLEDSVDHVKIPVSTTEDDDVWQTDYKIKPILKRSPIETSNFYSESKDSKKSHEPHTSPIKMALLASVPIIRKPTELKHMSDLPPEPPKRQSWATVENAKILKSYAFVKKYFLIAFDYVIEYLNKNSKDFRHVSHILAKEKIILKKEYGSSQTPNLLHLLSTAMNENEPDRQKRSLDELLNEKDNYESIILASKEVDDNMDAQSRINKLLSTIFFFMLSQTEIISYFFLILNHLFYASLLSVPLPIATFLWAMLCIPRPTKRFWITTITYIEAVVVIKYIFQFNVFPWNQSTTASNTMLVNTISIIGIEKRDNFALFDLFALLIIFLHRSILKRLGLWRDYLNDDEKSLASHDEEEDILNKHSKKDKTSGESSDSKSSKISNYKIESNFKA